MLCAEQNADRAFDMQNAAAASSVGVDSTGRNSRFGLALRTGTMSSRRSSEDSLEEEGRSLRDIRQEIKVRFDTFDFITEENH